MAGQCNWVAVNVVRNIREMQVSLWDGTGWGILFSWITYMESVH